jgi:hypothetical protein
LPLDCLHPLRPFPLDYLHPHLRFLCFHPLLKHQVQLHRRRRPVVN